MSMNFMNSVKMDKPKNNLFDMSHDVKMSHNMGDLVPTLVLPCVPGDKVSLGAETLLRFAPMISPVMHRFDVFTHYFFVPNRILWGNFENWITRTPDSNTGLPYAFPTLTVGPTSGHYNKLCDYMGFPDPAQTKSIANEHVSAFPFAAYQKICNEYYRDENLVPADYDKMLNDGSNDSDFFSMTTMHKRAWEHDYFTSALPFAQKGSAVSLPLGEVELKPTWFDDGDEPGLVLNDDGSSRGTGTVNQSASGGVGTPTLQTGGIIGDAHTPEAYDPDGSLVVGETTINELRAAFSLQRWLERAARGGTRYIEFIKSMFGVNSSDKRLQRPEYITGVKSPVVISEVLNTTGTDDAPQGNMSGHATSYTSGKVGRYTVEEHGYIIGITSVLPRTAYQQGIARDWLKVTDPTEWYFQDFAHLGEQPIWNSELMAYNTAPIQKGTFGYLPRYAEYKTMMNRVCGDFRTTLDFWHAGRILDPTTQPALNAAFIQSDPTDRIWAVIDEDVDHLYTIIKHNIMMVRPMPKFGTPSIY